MQCENLICVKGLNVVCLFHSFSEHLSENMNALLSDRLFITQSAKVLINGNDETDREKETEKKTNE